MVGFLCKCGYRNIHMCEDSNLYKRMCEWWKPGMLVDAEGEVADLGVI